MLLHYRRLFSAGPSIFLRPKDDRHRRGVRRRSYRQPPGSRLSTFLSSSNLLKLSPSTPPSTPPPPSPTLFAICFYAAIMLSTQAHDQSSLGLSMSAHQIFSGAPSTLSASPSPSIADKQKKTTCKRKRSNDAASESGDSTTQPTRTRDGPKKKKANRACFHCQKAHLTCDDCESPACVHAFSLLFDNACAPALA